MKVFPNSDIKDLMNPDSSLFKAVEEEFENWFEGIPSWMQEPYLGWGEDEPPVCSKKGAIIEAIEAMLTEASETGMPITIASFDFDAIFQS